ncbi:MAG: nitrogen fixation protein NifM [Gammaproteobacteria bacterium]|nr:nitrogen fixation protein NifM [Gammaproteobacteria bacterium]
MTALDQAKELAPEFSYHLLRNALERFQRNLGELEPGEYQAVYRSASKSYELESLVLASTEADGVVVPEAQIKASMDEVASRYASTREFLRDLETNGLDEDGLRRALHRELLFDGVMQRVSSKAAEISDIDVRLFYEMHHERFESPETRHARHILITLNPAYPENTRQAAEQRMQQVIDKLRGRSNRFADMARRFSECPTAMEGGQLGEIRRGMLYPELDKVLFGMEAQQISGIVETEIGLHVLMCDKIKPAKRIPLSRAEPRIREILDERRRRNCQKAWLNGLKPRQDS